MWRATDRRLRVGPALLTTVLYLAGGVGTPLLHLTTEVLRAGQGVEQGHSDGCATIHSDRSCVAVAAFQLPGALARQVLRNAATVPYDLRPRAADRPIIRHRRSSRKVRAPPSA